MNAAEADLAIDYIRECFPDTATWLDRQKTRKPPVPVQERWVRVLLEYPYWEVKLAVDKLFKGYEKFPDKHQNAISVILGIAGAKIEPEKRQKRTEKFTRPYRIGNEDTFKCKVCWDTGVVFVWHPETLDSAQAVIEARRDGKPDPVLRRYSAVVACHCEASHEKVAGVGGTRFDENVMLRCPVDWNEPGVTDELLRFASLRMF